MPLRRPPHLLLQAGGSLLARAGGAVLGLISAFVLAAWLGPGAYGILAYALSWALMLAPVAGLGLDVLATRELARARAVGDAGAAHTFVRWSLRTGAAAALGASAVVAVVAWGVPTAWLPEAAAGVRWIPALLAPLALLHPLAGMLQGGGRVVAAQLVQSVVPPLPVALFAPLLGVAGVLDLRMALLLQLSGALAAVAVAAALVRGAIADVPAADRRDGDACRRRWRDLRVFTALALLSVLGAQMGTVLAGSLAGAEQAAVFDLALRASGPVALVLFAVNVPVAPAVAAAWRRGTREEVRRTVRWATRTATAGGLVAAGVVLAAAPPVAARLGPGYEDLPAVLAVLCAGQLVNAACGPVGWVLTMTGHERRVPVAHAMAAGVQLLLAVLLVPAFGAFGAAIAAAAALAAWNVDLRLAVRRRLGL